MNDQEISEYAIQHYSKYKDASEVWNLAEHYWSHTPTKHEYEQCTLLEMMNQKQRHFDNLTEAQLDAMYREPWEDMWTYYSGITEEEMTENEDGEQELMKFHKPIDQTIDISGSKSDEFSTRGFNGHVIGHLAFWQKKTCELPRPPGCHLSYYKGMDEGSFKIIDKVLEYEFKFDNDGNLIEMEKNR